MKCKISRYLILFVAVLLLNDIFHESKFLGHRRKNKKLVGEIKTLAKKIKQPVILMPIIETCNGNFNYLKNGQDWNCKCKNGREQSPINLPKIEEAKTSSVKPVFVFKPIKNGRLLLENDLLKIKVDKSNDDDIKSRDLNDSYPEETELDAKDYNRIISSDGQTYRLQEIIFHTPSEHQINGKQFDLELQIVYKYENNSEIHQLNEIISSYSSNKIEFVILSFLFYKSAGAYNKFFQDLDYFNLPQTNIELKNLYIPKLFYTIDDNSMTTSRPFPFYTYLGSLTSPPCTEKVIHYVASDPIPLATIIIDQFKKSVPCGENNRTVQKSNGRLVFHHTNQN